MYTQMMQHPVGRGGLFSGYVSTGYRCIRWIYDCGSFNKKNELCHEINKVALGGYIDVLFISHLDDDHVNGVDNLLSLYNYLRMPIRTVMLPYFSDDISLGIMTKSGAQGSLSSTFIQMNEDIQQWFESRGVTKIIYVDNNGDGDPIPLIESPGDGDGGQEPTISLGGRTIVLDQTDPGPIAVHHQPNANIAVTISNRSGKNAFVLIPYAYEPKPHLVARFKKELIRVLGSDDRKTIISASKSSAGRGKLKNCYKKIWKTHNLISMSLYCGPVFKPSSGGIKLHTRKFVCTTDSGGWLLTGDSNLKGLDRRDKFLKHYKHYIPNVDTAMLPHHGSKGSFHSDLMNSLSSTRLFYATANHGEKKFPHPYVRSVIKRSKRRYQTVGTKNRSRIVVSGFM